MLSHTRIPLFPPLITSLFVFSAFSQEANNNAQPARCAPADEAFRSAPIDLSTAPPLQLCLPGEDPEKTYTITIRCSPSTTVPINALSQFLAAIPQGVDQLINVEHAAGLNTTLREAPRLLDQLGGQVCVVQPDGLPDGPLMTPTTTDANPRGACFRLSDTPNAPEGSPVLTVGGVASIVRILQSVDQRKVSRDINECHIGVGLPDGSQEWASGCWGAYDKAKHLSADGQTHFECPA